MIDNLLAEGKSMPLAAAIPNNQMIHRSHSRHVELTLGLFEAEMRKHVIPLVEAGYSVRKEPQRPRLSGLSMGGRHTMFVGFCLLDLFASFEQLMAMNVGRGKSYSAPRTARALSLADSRHSVRGLSRFRHGQQVLRRRKSGGMFQEVCPHFGVGREIAPDDVLAWVLPQPSRGRGDQALDIEMVRIDKQPDQ